MKMTSNARTIAARMAARAAATVVAVEAVVPREGAVLQTKVKANASGRPGPRAQTGDYRRNIGLVVRRATRTVTAEVFTNAVQGWRLEMRLLRRGLARPALPPGRRCPHFQPAADAMRAQFPAAVATAVNVALQVTR
jgi:hypothetical protein